MARSLKLQAVVYKEGRHFIAQCLNVEVSSFGSSEPAALTNLKEALELYFEDPTIANISQVKTPAIKSLSVQGA